MISSSGKHDGPDGLHSEEVKVALAAIRAGDVDGLRHALKDVKSLREVANDAGGYLLHQAVEAKQNNVEMCEALLSLGLDPSTRIDMAIPPSSML